MNTRSRRDVRSKFISIFVLVAVVLACGVSLFGQATIQSGNIQGTVTDSSSAVIPGAKVTITSKDTGQTMTFNTTSSGNYVSGPLSPGSYLVRVEAQGFATSELSLVVRVGNVTPGNVKLIIGAQSQVVEVQAEAERVNTEQATVQGVITAAQMQSMPINGRNFLDAAQLEPGVQIQDASNFDPTKIGFTAISVGGRQGRTTRIEVDGLDITDETVGTTTQNIPTSAIDEFQISQSSLDFSTELTSSGAVNVATKPGSNSYHGEAFYLFRDKRAGAANFPGGQDLPYQRNDVGFNFGGPVVKDKLFFMLAGERVLQHLRAPLTFSPPFDKYNGGFGSPFKDKQGNARLDYNPFSSAKLFYRITYDNFTALGNMVPNYEVIANLNNTPSHAAGLDFTTGSFTHSVRFGYLKFQNHIANGIVASGAFNPLPDAPADYRVTSTSPQFRFGYNYLAPQATFQSNKQIKYDGSKIFRSHIFRYGVSLNKILGGGLANFWGMGPSIRSSTKASAIPANSPFEGGASNPLNYPVTTIYLGNGQGYFTEKPEFGYPAGGQWDSRFQWYFGDTWKVKQNFTLTMGLRYNRDTGRTDSDLGPIPCSAINPANFDPMPPCTGNLMDNFGDIKGMGDRVRQPNSNFGGTLGLAWDPWKNGKTVIRAGAGLYYENMIFNSVMFDRPVRLATGLFNSITANLCPGGQLTFPGGVPVTTTPSGKDIATEICGQPMGSVASDIVALQTAFQAAVAKAGASANPNFVGETLEPDLGGGLYYPNLRTPRSYQMNFGVQHQVLKDGVLSVDYIRNIGLRFLVGMDTNHVGDARYLNKAAAEFAIATTLENCGVTSISAGLLPGACAFSPTSGKPLTTPRALTIADFANNGLDSGTSYFGGQPAEAYFTHPDEGAAFAGINPWYGANTMQFSSGRSVYNALQVSYRQRANNLTRFLPGAQFNISYSLSRFESIMADQDFVSGAPNDNANMMRYFGPNGFDRTHQLSFGTVFTLPGHGLLQGPQLSFIGHFNSPLPQDLRLQDQGRSGEIFHTDFTGDGTTGDILPGTNIGSFMRGVSPGTINNVINAYNSTYGGKLTPAGQALVAAGLFTETQLTSLGAVMDTVPLAPVGQVGNGWLRAFDVKLAVPIKVTERVKIEPSINIFNVMNFANYANSPNTLVSGILSGSAGTANGTTYGQHGNRAGLGSGVFQVGAPRQMEFGLRLTF